MLGWLWFSPPGFWFSGRKRFGQSLWVDWELCTDNGTRANAGYRPPSVGPNPNFVSRLFSHHREKSLGTRLTVTARAFPRLSPEKSSYLCWCHTFLVVHSLSLPSSKSTFSQPSFQVPVDCEEVLFLILVKSSITNISGVQWKFEIDRSWERKLKWVGGNRSLGAERCGLTCQPVSLLRPMSIKRRGRGIERSCSPSTKRRQGRRLPRKRRVLFCFISLDKAARTPQRHSGALTNLKNWNFANLRNFATWLRLAQGSNSDGSKRLVPGNIGRVVSEWQLFIGVK